MLDFQIFYLILCQVKLFPYGIKPRNVKIGARILNREIFNMTTSLTGFFWGLSFGAIVLGLIAISLVVVSQKDKVVRR